MKWKQRVGVESVKKTTRRKSCQASGFSDHLKRKQRSLCCHAYLLTKLFRKDLFFFPKEKKKLEGCYWHLLSRAWLLRFGWPFGHLSSAEQEYSRKGWDPLGKGTGRGVCVWEEEPPSAPRHCSVVRVSKRGWGEHISLHLTSFLPCIWARMFWCPVLSGGQAIVASRL